MKRALVILAIFAFIIQLQDGRRICVRDAVGFQQQTVEWGSGEKKEMKAVHSFFDKDGKGIMAIRSDAIVWAMYLPENSVM